MARRDWAAVNWGDQISGEEVESSEQKVTGDSNLTSASTTTKKRHQSHELPQHAQKTFKSSHMDNAEEVPLITVLLNAKTQPPKMTIKTADEKLLVAALSSKTQTVDGVEKSGAQIVSDTLELKAHLKNSSASDATFEDMKALCVQMQEQFAVFGREFACKDASKEESKQNKALLKQIEHFNQDTQKKLDAISSELRTVQQDMQTLHATVVSLGEQRTHPHGIMPMQSMTATHLQASPTQTAPAIHSIREPVNQAISVEKQQDNRGPTQQQAKYVEKQQEDNRGSAAQEYAEYVKKQQAIVERSHALYGQTGLKAVGDVGSGQRGGHLRGNGHALYGQTGQKAVGDVGSGQRGGHLRGNVNGSGARGGRTSTYDHRQKNANYGYPVIRGAHHAAGRGSAFRPRRTSGSSSSDNVANSTTPTRSLRGIGTVHRPGLRTAQRSTHAGFLDVPTNQQKLVDELSSAIEPAVNKPPSQSCQGTRIFELFNPTLSFIPHHGQVFDIAQVHQQITVDIDIPKNTTTAVALENPVAQKNTSEQQNEEQSSQPTIDDSATETIAENAGAVSDGSPKTTHSDGTGLTTDVSLETTTACAKEVVCNDTATKDADENISLEPEGQQNEILQTKNTEGSSVESKQQQIDGNDGNRDVVQPTLEMHRHQIDAPNKARVAVKLPPQKTPLERTTSASVEPSLHKLSSKVVLKKVTSAPPKGPSVHNVYLTHDLLPVNYPPVDKNSKVVPPTSITKKQPEGPHRPVATAAKKTTKSTFNLKDLQIKECSHNHAGTYCYGNMVVFCYVTQNPHGRTRANERHNYLFKRDKQTIEDIKSMLAQSSSQNTKA